MEALKKRLKKNVIFRVNFNGDIGMGHLIRCLRIIKKDYRKVQNKFDRVYSIGMFEHVGRKNYQEYYDTCYKLLKKNGIMLIHTIMTSQFNSNQDLFIHKYIFPEGELPHLNNMTQEYNDKWYLEDVQNIGHSYAKTLRNWHKNIGNWEGLENYSIKFRRMWEMYLLSCAAAFDIKNIYLFQFVYIKRDSDYKDNLHHIRKC